MLKVPLSVRVGGRGGREKEGRKKKAAPFSVYTFTVRGREGERNPPPLTLFKSNSFASLSEIWGEA